MLHRDRHRTEIPIGFCVNLSISVSVCLGVGQCERTIINTVAMTTVTLTNRTGLEPIHPVFSFQCKHHYF